MGEIEPPEGARRVESDNNYNDSEVPTWDPEPGDVIEGQVVSVLTRGEDERGFYGKLRVTDEERGLIDVWAKWETKQALRDGEIVEGTELYIAVEEETTDVDGSAKHKHCCWIIDGGDA